MLKRYFLPAIIAAAFALPACKNKTTEKKTAGNKDSIAAAPKPAAKPMDTAASATTTIKAKFTEMTQGDISHFIFVDEAGKNYDFAEIDDMDLELASSLPKEESNTTNQGWGPNKAMLNKWFNVTYRKNMQLQYEGGPMAEALIIVTAKPAQ